MRNPSMRLGAAVFFVVSVMPLLGQEPTGQGNRGVQVGVPDGRNPGDGGSSNRRPRRNDAPPPRAADGHALLGSTRDQKGLWRHGPGVPDPVGLTGGSVLPFT